MCMHAIYRQKQKLKTVHVHTLFCVYYLVSYDQLVIVHACMVNTDFVASVCVFACVRACVRASVRVCVRVCVCMQVCDV